MLKHGNDAGRYAKELTVTDPPLAFLDAVRTNQMEVVKFLLS